MQNVDASPPIILVQNGVPWWKNLSGIFQDEPVFDSVMQAIEENREREREEANRLADEAERIENPAATMQKAG